MSASLGTNPQALFVAGFIAIDSHTTQSYFRDGSSNP
jgi:hypothetical protein